MGLHLDTVTKAGARFVTEEYEEVEGRPMYGNPATIKRAYIASLMLDKSKWEALGRPMSIRVEA